MRRFVSCRTASSSPSPLARRVPLRAVVTSLLLAAALAGTGCSHAMHVTNLDSYRPMPSPPTVPARSVGLTARNLDDPEVRGYVDGIAEGLRRDASFERVVYPFDPRAGHDVDVVFDVQVVTTYAGRGSNFLVNWPGFLIFAPAIWGYGYEASIVTKALVWTRDGATNALEIPTVYDFRHASIGRTWTELGWLEVSIIPFIGGIVFTRYDAGATPQFVSLVAPSYGAYVAQRLRESLGPARARPAVSAPAAPSPSPPLPPPAASPPPVPSA